jgi:hypothetical protein
MYRAIRACKHRTLPSAKPTGQDRQDKTASGIGREEKRRLNGTSDCLVSWRSLDPSIRNMKLVRSASSIHCPWVRNESNDLLAWLIKKAPRARASHSVIEV